MKYLWPVIVILAAILFGCFLGEFHYHRVVKNDFNIIKSIFDNIKVFAEVTYYVTASFLILFAYSQYRNEKWKGKALALQYTHQLFRMYVEDILPLDDKFDDDSLEQITPEGDSDNFKEFHLMLNKLDIFAAPFITGIADIETGFKLMGKTYCDQILSYTPTIKNISGANYEVGLENLFKLYREWKDTDG